MMQDLPYKCQQVLELYGSKDAEVDQLEKIKKLFTQIGVVAEMYYSNREDISYATLVIFLPRDFHAELSQFDLKAFQKWHGLFSQPE